MNFIILHNMNSNFFILHPNHQDLLYIYVANSFDFHYLRNNYFLFHHLKRIQYHNIILILLYWFICMQFITYGICKEFLISFLIIFSFQAYIEVQTTFQVAYQFLGRNMKAFLLYSEIHSYTMGRHFRLCFSYVSTNYITHISFY